MSHHRAQRFLALALTSQARWQTATTASTAHTIHRACTLPTAAAPFSSSAAIRLAATSVTLTSADRKAAARAKGKAKAKPKSKSTGPTRKSSLSKGKQKSPNRGKPKWLQEERKLREELHLLESKLEKLDKRARSARAEEQLPPLDEEALTQIYDALTLPAPVTQEEKRLLEAAGRRRIELAAQRTRAMFPDSRAQGTHALPDAQHSDALSLSSGTGTDAKQPTLTYQERLRARLTRLCERLHALDTVSHDARGAQPGTSAHADLTSEVQQDRKSLAARIGSLLKERAQQPEDSDGPVGEAQRTAPVRPHEGNVPSQLRPALPTLDSTSLSTDQRARTQVLDRLEDLIDRAQRTAPLDRRAESAEREDAETGDENAADAGAGAGLNEPDHLPLGIATAKEWTALAVACVSNLSRAAIIPRCDQGFVTIDPVLASRKQTQSSDDRSLARVLSLMKVSARQQRSAQGENCFLNIVLSLMLRFFLRSARATIHPN